MWKIKGNGKEGRAAKLTDTGKEIASFILPWKGLGDSVFRLSGLSLSWGMLPDSVVIFRKHIYFGQLVNVSNDWPGCFGAFLKIGLNRMRRLHWQAEPSIRKNLRVHTSYCPCHLGVVMGIRGHISCSLFVV